MDAPAPARAATSAAAPGRRPRLLLATCFHIPEHPGTGGAIRLAALAAALREAGDVEVVHVDPPRPDDSPLSRGQFVDEAALAAAWRPGRLGRRTDSPAARALAAAAPARFDAVVLGTLAIAWWTGWTDPRRTIVNLDEPPSQLYQQGLCRGHPLLRPAKWLRYRRMRWSERRLLDAFRFTLICCEDDRRYLRHPRAAVVTNCYWPATPASPTAAPGGDGPDAALTGCGPLLFVGTLADAKNLRGLAWFVREVLPLLRQARPDVTLTVVGRMPPEQRGDWSWTGAPGVDFRGTVPSVEPYVRGCAVEVCPLLDGRGTRIKIIESLALGTPVVATTIGAYGLDAGEDQGLLRRDAPAEFAQACLELLADEPRRRRIAAAGSAHARATMSPRTVAQQVGELVQTIVRENGLRPGTQG